MPAAPPPHIIEAINSAVTTITRRVEVYESDGITRWSGDNGLRLLDGSVSVDYSRDERRSVDLRLDNSDGALRGDPNGGFWYDKILKVYRGVQMADQQVVVSKNYAPNADFDTVTTDPYVGVSGTLSHRATGGYGAGAAIQLIANSAPTTSTYIQYYTPHATVQEGDQFTASVYVKSGQANLTSRVWLVYQDASGVAIGAASASAYVTMTGAVQRISATLPAAPFAASRVRMIVYLRGSTGAEAPPAAAQLIMDRPLLEKSATMNDWFLDERYVTLGGTWECQIGEFMIDRLAEPHFPNIVTVTGRDYSKKLQTSKFLVATQFTTGTTVETVIRAIAQNGGITRFLFPPTGKTLGRDFLFERGVPRWQAMTEIATAYGLEVFFDTQGICVLQEFQDPSTSPLVARFLTGEEGNLASYDKSANDSRLYNHIVVTGEATDVAPVFAEARNDQPNSPTRIARIGDRVYQYTSAFITTVAQAQGVADAFLKVHALEEFEVGLGSIVYPWLEAGDIVDFIDPKAAVNQPTRFLLSSFTIPLTLGAMTGTAKRVAIVSG